MKKDLDTPVDRSRLTLLIGLTSTAAAAACMPAVVGDPTPNTTRKSSEPVGGEGGEGGGGGSH